jgi:MYXO-CTERM domain-containing protein
MRRATFDGETMTTRAWTSIGVFILTFAAPFVVASPAAAQEACGDTECPKGYECKTEEESCPAIDCANGEECPPCEPQEVEYCSPLPCASDADCASDMTCYSEDVEECTGGSAPCARPEDGGAAECPPPVEEECTTTRRSQCVPRYLLPCETASDCGAGFTCDEIQRCGCSSSAGSSGSDGDPSEPVPADSEAGTDSDPDCTCEPTGKFMCQAIVTACSSDTDCESGWTCIDNPEGVCSSDSEGNTDCEPADPARLCVPPHYDLVEGGRGIGRGASEDGGGTSSPTGGESDDAADADSEEGTSGGCAMTPARQPTALLVLALGLAAAFAARRRKLGA